MKKILCILLSLAAVVTLSACGKDDDDQKKLESYKQEEIVKTEEKVGEDVFKFESIDSETVTITGYSGPAVPHPITIPDQLGDKFVAAISVEAFANHSQISAVDFSKATRLEAIEDFAFRGCEMITELTLPAAISTIGQGTFYGCTGLTKVTFQTEGDLTEIPEEAFMECTALTEISIPGNIKKIGRAAFFGCTGLTALTIADGVEEIGNNAFQDCENLSSVLLPEFITIGDYAFSGTPYDQQ